VSLARGGLAPVLAVAAVTVLPGLAPTAGATGEDGQQRFVFGHSAAGRALVAEHHPSGAGGRVLLVIGAIHGDETAGIAVVDALRRLAGRSGVDVWTVTSVNPDGVRAHRRQNSHGVDLNRNFSVRWRSARRGSPEWGGPRSFSEPESRAVRRLVQRVRPDVTIWYHQPWGVVLLPCHGPAPARVRYARRAHIKTQRCRGEDLPGTATAWQHRVDPDAEAFVVELAAGRLSATAARRHAAAALAATAG
jgi:protein MpaA